MAKTGTTCAFCTNEQIKARTVIENELVWAFPTNIPITVGHTIICPKRHVATLSDLTDPERLALLQLADQIRQAIVMAFGAEGFNYAWNEGEFAGQSVPHFHLHVVPRKPGDQGIYHYEPRQFLYRPGSRPESPEVELQQLASALRAKL